MNTSYDLILDYNKESELDNYYFSNDIESKIKYLYNFNSINIFVGANNSGKSRFLRGLINHKNLKGVCNIDLILQLIEEHNRLLELMNFKIPSINGNFLKQHLKYDTYYDEFNELEFKDVDNVVFTKLNLSKDLNVLNSSIESNIQALNKAIFLEKVSSNNPKIRRSIITATTGEQNEGFFIFFSLYSLNYQEVLNEFREKFKVRKEFIERKIYIPTLRTAHSLFKDLKSDDNNSIFNKKIKDDIFVHTVRKNYKNLSKDVDIFTGLNLYKDIVNVRNSIKEERTRFHDFEDFLKENFFEGKDVDIVAKFNLDNNEKQNEDEDIIQIYIGGKSRELHNLGDGVQSLIILMYKIFLADNDSMIFIDEPELNLHPGYQRLFLEQITSNKVLTKKNLTYVIVTHSNHFLDLTLEKDNISIYSFSSFQKVKNDAFLIRNANSGDNQILRDLGVNNSSVFLANCSIWVEGISDRNFIKAFLYAYCIFKKEPFPLEDIDFAFFEYAGSNLTHYNFKKGTNDSDEIIDLITSYALNNKILLVSDFDFGKETKHNNIAEIAKETDGFEYYTTKPYREIENLLDNSIWSKVLLNFCNQRKIKGNEHNVQLRIEQLLSNLDSNKYKSKYIGEFLRDLKISELNKVYQIDDEMNPGTFIPKAELSQLVLQKVRDEEITWKDFSKNETIAFLTETIYKFIVNAKA